MGFHLSFIEILLSQIMLIMSITQEVHKLGKPIYAFDNTSKHQSGESHVYPVQNPEMMVEEIKSYLATLAD